MKLPNFDNWSNGELWKIISENKVIKKLVLSKNVLLDLFVQGLDCSIPQGSNPLQASGFVLFNEKSRRDSDYF